jgi:PAS domain S-box-containing protein
MQDANIEAQIMKELQKLKVHDKCCFIYETEAEWEFWVIPFIKEGLINGEKCIYQMQRRDKTYITACFVNQGIDVNGYISSGQLLLIPTNENFPDLSKSMDEIVDRVANRLDQFLNEGYSTLRLSNESIAELLFNDDSRSRFLEIQLRLNRDIYPHYPIKSLLQYHRHEDHPLILRDAVISHHCIFRAGHIERNLATIPPEIYFQHKDTAWEAEYWLRMQEALLDSENKYRLIFEHSLDMITIIDAKSYEILFISPAHSKLLDYSPEEVIGHNCLDFIHPGQREMIEEEFRKEFMGSSGAGVCAVIKQDGSYLWTEGKGNVIRQIGSNDQIVLFTRDVHDKKLAEDALFKSEQKLRYQLSYMNTLINNMNELCLTYDRDSCLTFVNQRLVEKLGYRAEEMLGKPLLDFIIDEHKEAVAEQLEQRLQGKIGSHEHRFLCKDGSELLVELKGSPILEDDKITGGLVLADDITQQRQMERDMARLGQLHLVGEMAASIAHEIRNPMTTVLGFLQIMSQKEEFRDHSEYFDLMIEELNRANLIISEFLSLAGNKMVDLRCHNLNTVIQALAPLLMADALNGDKNIKFELSKLPDLLLDENEIRQLILNLVRNGLEAMEEGGSVTVKSWREDDKVMFAVQDEGSGIPEEIIDKLGTPFLSTKVNGTGLGLAVCYSIAARHQAHLEVASSPQGSTFTVVFNCA